MKALKIIFGIPLLLVGYIGMLIFIFFDAMSNISQAIIEYLIQQEWFRDQFPRHYFVKVNGTWSMYKRSEFSKITFTRGQNIEDITGPGIYNWIYCQNHDCHSVINFDSSFIERKVNRHFVWDYTCSCCGIEQHFLGDFPPIPCDPEGIPLPSTI